MKKKSIIPGILCCARFQRGKDPVYFRGRPLHTLDAIAPTVITKFISTTKKQSLL